MTTRLEAIRQRVERASEHLSGAVGEDSIAVLVGEDTGAFIVPMGLADYAALAIHANRDIPALLAVVEAALREEDLGIEATHHLVEDSLCPHCQARRAKMIALIPLKESVE